MMSMEHGIDFTSEETNNIVYLCLKYSFNIKDPSNQDIKDILLMTVGDSSTDNIVKCLFKYVRCHYPSAIGIQKNQERHIRFIIDEFTKLPYTTKNDLGADKEAEEFITKH